MTSHSATDTGKPESGGNDKTAILALTRKGAGLALRLRGLMPGSSVFCHERYAPAGVDGFAKTAELLAEIWPRFGAIVCIMASGIVVRSIAPLLKKKTVDPAVVVVDEEGRFAISLLSGHLGGANALAREVAGLLSGQAVITTATDLSGKPAVDLMAKDAGLQIENPGRLAAISAAVLDDAPVWLFDPWRLLVPRLPEACGFEIVPGVEGSRTGPGIWVSETNPPSRIRCLKLRPRNLVAGIGCNRNTRADEIMDLIKRVFSLYRLSLLSIRNLASIDLKSDETGLLEAAQLLDRPIFFGSRGELSLPVVPNPSETVARHIGVASVCEASALWSAQNGELIVPKTKSANCTVAVARADLR